MPIGENIILLTTVHFITEADEVIDKLTGKAKDIVGDAFKNK